MKEFLIIAGIALLVLLIFVFLDKGKNFFKKNKTPKIKEEKTSKKNKIESESSHDKEDYDTKIKEENVEYGKLPEVQSFNEEEEQPSEKLFVENLQEQEEIDIDKMFEDLRRKQVDENIFDETQYPNFDDMSMSELDSFLEQSFDDYDMNSYGKSALGNYGYDDDLTGEELGKVLKGLPRQIKILLLSDILKRKF